MSEILECVYVIIGAYIGAGFISGKEIYLYFFRYGYGGIINILIVSFYVGILMNKVIKICQNQCLDSYDIFLENVINNEMTMKLFKIIISLFLLVGFELMMTGMCSLISNISKINKYVVFLFLYIFLIIIFHRKVEHILKINSVMIPVVVVFLIYICVFKQNVHINISRENVYYSFNPSFLYANYNLLCLIPMGILIAKRARNGSRVICCISSLLICVLSLMIFSILASGSAEVCGMDFPLLEIIKSNGMIYERLYYVMLFIAIFTTAVSQGYSYMWQGEKHQNVRAIVMLVAGIFFLSFSFSKLIEMVYPVFGAVGLILSMYIIVKK